MKNDLFLSLGSNVEPRQIYINYAVGCLNRYFEFVKMSSLYETEPVLCRKQTLFYNLCVKYKTDIEDPYKVLEITQAIEVKTGRIKRGLKGPREIDIDIIFFGETELNSEILTIPHREFLARRFVLEPMLEILPENSEYIKKYDMINHKNKITDQKIFKIGELIIGS